MLGVERVDDVYAGQILSRDAVYLIGQLLHEAEARQYAEHDDEYQRDYRNDEARRHGRQLPALAENLYHRPHGHDRRLYHHLKPHRNDHLQLGDVVRSAGDETRHGEFTQLLGAEVHHVAEHLFAHGVAEAGRDPRREIAADDCEQGARQRTAEHLQADVQNVDGLRVGAVDELRDVGHIIGQGQVKIYLPQNEQRAYDRHYYLAPLHIFQ